MSGKNSLCAAVAITTSLLVTACATHTPGHSPTFGQAPSEAPAPIHRTQQAEVIGFYLAARSLEFNLESDRIEGNSVIDSYFTGRGRDVIIDEMSQNNADGIAYSGRVKHNASLEWMSPDAATAIIRDCVDVSQVTGKKRKGGEFFSFPPQVLRYTSTATLTKNNSGRWLISDLQSDRSRPCP